MMLYAGSDRKIPRKQWTKDAPDISVADLEGEEEAVRGHFSKPEVQTIGSTSGCGCDFPNALLQSDGWQHYDLDPEDLETEAYNRKALVDLLRATGERDLELYAVWWGNFEEDPEAREDISLGRILDPDFRFKEHGFYRVTV